MGQGVILVDKNYRVLFANKTINSEFSDLNIGDKLFKKSVILNLKNLSKSLE